MGSSLTFSLRPALFACGCAAFLAHASFAQCEVGQITAPGSRVAADGDWVVIGDVEGEASDLMDGRVSILRRVGESYAWKLHTLLADRFPEEMDLFAQDVAIDGDVVCVGARGTDLETGAVYVYRFDGAAWKLEQVLTASDAILTYEFGSDIDIEADRMLIGAKGGESGGILGAGAAYVFRCDDGVWVEEAKLEEPHPSLFDLFGDLVRLDGNRAAITAFGNDAAGPETGAVFMFVRQGGVWSFEQMIVPPDPQAQHGFGVASLSDDLLAVGASRDSIQQGAAYLFSYDEGRWQLEQKVVPVGVSGPHPFFGNSMFVDAELQFFVGGATRDYAQGPMSGAAFVFHREEGSWSETARLTASDGGPGDFFGASTSFANGVLFSSSPGFEEGKTYAFTGFANVDCNGNGEPDACDIFHGVSEDLDGDSIPDECQCPADITGDGLVGFADLLLVLSNWEQKGGAADVNLDGTVDEQDLLLVLSGWGPCASA